MGLDTHLRDTLFEITFSNSKSIFLTDASNYLEYNGKYYLPNSGLKIKNVYLTNKKQKIILTGILDKGGIEEKEDLTHLKIKIDFLKRYPSIQHEHFITCFCSFVKIEHNIFEIEAYSFLEKLNITLTKRYSKSCRAELADKDCLVNLKNNVEQYDIEEIRGSEIKISGCTRANNFYEGGDAFFNLNKNDYDSFYKRSVYEMHETKFLVTNHKLFGTIKKNDQEVAIHVIKLMLPGGCLPSHLLELGKVQQNGASYIFLLKRCDKTLESCQSFHNVNNFRGEPYYIKTSTT